jgi:hypothetical protein
MIRVSLVVLVHDRMDADRLLVDGKDGTGWDINPILCGLMSVDILKWDGEEARNEPAQLGVSFLPLSNDKGSLATSTTSAPLSLLSI